MKDRHYCKHCEGKGYIEIRDCSGEIQREETCSFCCGLGYFKDREDREKNTEVEVLRAKE